MKTKLIGILVLAIVLPVLAFASMASAQTFRSGQTPTVASSEIINGSAFVTGSTIDVAGKINGDLYCAGQNVTISGEVDGDILCAAQTITVSGSVTGDVRLAAQTVAMSGKVNGSATIAAQTVTIEGQGNVNRDAVLFAQSLTVNGQVGRDITLASGNAVIDSTVGRNVNAQIENLTLGKNAIITGTVDYTSPNQLIKNTGAQVTGKINYTKQEVQQQQNYANEGIGATLFGTLMLIVSALIFVLLFPGQLHRTTEASATSVRQTFLALVVGFVASIIIPVAIVLLMITVLGIPFAFVVLTAWALAVALSGAFAAYYVGRIVWQKQTNAVLIMLAGVLILAIAFIIPILNFFVWLLVVWYGTGVILLQLRKHAVTPRYEMQKIASKK